MKPAGNDVVDADVGRFDDLDQMAKEASEVYRKRERGIRHPRVYRAVKHFTNRGLPGLFVLFIVVYFAIGATFYVGVLQSMLTDGKGGGGGQ